MTLKFHEEVVRLLRAGHVLAVATVVFRQGSTPRASGCRMIVTGSGGTWFSIGGGAFEALVIEDAREALRAGQGCEKEYRFTEQGEGATGMVCGGSTRVLIEIVRPPLPLFIFGGGHVGREVARLAARLDFEVTVVDDRPQLLEADRYPEGVRTVRVEHDFSAGLPEIPPGACDLRILPVGQCCTYHAPVSTTSTLPSGASSTSDGWKSGSSLVTNSESRARNVEPSASSTCRSTRRALCWAEKREPR